LRRSYVKLVIIRGGIFLKTTVEFENCDLKIKYMGTPENIAFQELLNTIKILIDLLREEFSDSLRSASEILKSFSELLEK